MVAVLNAVAALFGFLDYRFLKLSQPIGLVINALLRRVGLSGITLRSTRSG
jgi:hypothetical protein